MIILMVEYLILQLRIYSNYIHYHESTMYLTYDKLGQTNSNFGTKSVTLLTRRFNVKNYSLYIDEIDIKDYKSNKEN